MFIKNVLYRLIDYKGLCEVDGGEYEALAIRINSLGGTLIPTQLTPSGSIQVYTLGKHTVCFDYLPFTLEKFFVPVEPLPMEAVVEVPPNEPSNWEELRDKIIEFPRKNRVMVASTPSSFPLDVTCGATTGIHPRMAA